MAGRLLVCGGAGCNALLKICKFANHKVRVFTKLPTLTLIVFQAESTFKRRMSSFPPWESSLIKSKIQEGQEHVLVETRPDRSGPVQVWRSPPIDFQNWTISDLVLWPATLFEPGGPLLRPSQSRLRELASSQFGKRSWWLPGPGEGTVLSDKFQFLCSFRSSQESDRQRPSP